MKRLTFASFAFLIGCYCCLVLLNIRYMLSRRRVERDGGEIHGLSGSSRGVQTVTDDAISAIDEKVECRPLRRGEAFSSGWFEENFNPSLRPTLTKQNINISQDVFHWWNNLLFESNSTYETYRDLAMALVNNSDVFNGNKPRDCVRCAVVGNSGNLKKSGYGTLIDMHDIIIRMNKSPTSGYESDVGTRTTHYLAYPLSYHQELNQSKEACFVLAAFNVKDIQWLNGSLNSRHDLEPDKQPQPSDKNKVFILNPELIWHIKHQWGLGKGRWPSTGILAMFFAIQLCDEVNIFGYGATSKGNWDHYFEQNDGAENSLFRKTNVHDSDAEQALMQKLSEAKKVTIYKGSR